MYNVMISNHLMEHHFSTFVYLTNGAGISSIGDITSYVSTAIYYAGRFYLIAREEKNFKPVYL